MICQRAFRIGGGSLIGLNIILLAVLTGFIIGRFPSGESTVDVHEGNIAEVQRTLESLNESSQASGFLTFFVLHGVWKDGKNKGTPQNPDLKRLSGDLARIYKRDGNLKKPAIHLVITPHDNRTAEDVPVLLWKNSINVSYQSESVKHDDGALSVTHGGYYYIYSTIRYTGDGTEELDYGRIIHNVLMKKESEQEESPTILMQNLQSTPTIRRGRQAYVTSSLGSTFYLPPNSKVMVTSSIPRNVDTSPYASYVGLFLN